jgi:formate dehydrogenase subunit delta
MSCTEDKLVYMANQIARNFAAKGNGAAEATADHIVKFWDPRMRAKILAHDAQDPALSAITLDAIALLRAQTTARAG